VANPMRIEHEDGLRDSKLFKNLLEHLVLSKNGDREGNVNPKIGDPDVRIFSSTLGLIPPFTLPNTGNKMLSRLVWESIGRPGLGIGIAQPKFFYYL